jgi:hypothetical protein
MKFEKILSRPMERCYAVGAVEVDQRIRVLFATEGQGKCRQFFTDGTEGKTVWFGPGGTMCFVPVPGKNGDFLAVQNFFPTFDSKHAVIVWCTPSEDGSWQVKTILNLPYVHRFDILRAGGVNYFVGCTLCTSKADQNDWSDPGKIWVGRLPDSPEEEIQVEPLVEGLLKNHGYCHVSGGEQKGDYGLVTSENGVLRLEPPKAWGDKWKVTPLTDRPTGDVAVWDLYGDGRREYLMIHPFHGDSFALYEEEDGGLRQVWQYEKEVDFGHTVQGGVLCGKNCFLLGYRKKAAELVCLTYENGAFRTQVIEAGGGPSNVWVFHENGRDYVACANRMIGEAALYQVTAEN